MLDLDVEPIALELETDSSPTNPGRRDESPAKQHLRSAEKAYGAGRVDDALDYATSLMHELRSHPQPMPFIDSLMSLVLTLDMDGHRDKARACYSKLCATVRVLLLEKEMSGERSRLWSQLAELHGLPAELSTSLRASLAEALASRGRAQVESKIASLLGPGGGASKRDLRLVQQAAPGLYTFAGAAGKSTPQHHRRESTRTTKRHYVWPLIACLLWFPMNVLIEIDGHSERLLILLVGNLLVGSGALHYYDQQRFRKAGLIFFPMFGLLMVGLSLAGLQSLMAGKGVGILGLLAIIVVFDIYKRWRALLDDGKGSASHEPGERSLVRLLMGGIFVVWGINALVGKMPARPENMSQEDFRTALMIGRGISLALGLVGARMLWTQLRER